MSLVALIVGVEADINTARRLLAYIKTPKFDRLFIAATSDQRNILSEHIRFKRYNTLREYVRSIESVLELDYEDYSVDRLRSVASGLGVSNYTRLQKDELIERIRENELRAVPDSPGDNSQGRPVGGLGYKPN